MATTREGWFTTSDGAKIYEKTWIPSNSPPTAHLIALHGFSDHINAYYSLFPTLASAPYSIAVHGIDQRGWGRSCQSAADNGKTGPTSTVLRDINEYALHVQTQISQQKNDDQSLTTDNATPPPLFLLGHSMGGQQALHYLLTTSTSTTRTRPVFSGLILESPYVALDASSEPSTLVVLLGKLAASLLPQRQLKQKLDATYMSRSAAVRDAWARDPLCHDTGTLEGLRDMLGRAAALTALARGVKTSGPALTDVLPCAVLWTHGTADKVTSFELSRALCARVTVGAGQRKDEIWYPGAFHKLHAEPDGVGERFAADVGAWVVSVVEEGRKGGQAVGGDASAPQQEELRSKL